MAKSVAVDIHANNEARQRLVARSLGANPRPSMASSGAGEVTKFLVEQKLLEAPMARAAQMDAKARGVPVAQVLGEQGAVPRDKIVAAIESTDVGRLASALDFDVRLPKRLLRELKVVVHAQTDTRLMVSTMSNISMVRQQLSPYVDGREIIEVHFSYAKWIEFEQGLDRIFEPDQERVNLSDENNSRSVVPDIVDDAEVLDLLIDYAASQGVSDIHIEPQKQTFNVFFRYLGKRKLGHCGTIDQYSRVCAMVKDRARVDPMETRVPQDGSFSTQVRGRPYDIRVATVPTDGKEKITMRLLDPIRAQMPLSQLGISQLDAWRRINEYRNGLVLIVGATGSGKTTTLNATIREMDRLEKAIYTAEDPVEYHSKFVTHVGINEAVGLDFARSIKAFMRSDPDVIILGEIRDPVTASKAIQAAETGHLVIATIHAESVPMALQRLRGLDVKTEDFEMLLRGVLVQFLVRSICSECEGAGCEDCYGEGYAGRTVVSEIARVRTPQDVRRMMSTDPKDKYWEPLWKDLEAKVLSGVTDGREVYRTFSSELEEMAQHSDVLKAILVEERAKRDIASDNVSVAQVEALSAPEKRKARAIARARLRASSVPIETAVADAAASNDGDVMERPEAAE
jgi:general secretion pathway protein E